jgi:imidazolonepropionase
MGLTLEEALVASTINAAYAIDRHALVGSLEAGKQMDAVIVDGEAVDLIRVGGPGIRTVVKKGRVAWTAGPDSGPGTRGLELQGSPTAAPRR